MTGKCLPDQICGFLEAYKLLHIPRGYQKNRLSLSISLSISLSFSLAPCLALSRSLSLSISLALSLSLSLSLSLYIYIYILSLSLSLAVSFSLFLSLSIYFYLSLSLSFCLSHPASKQPRAPEGFLRVSMRSKEILRASRCLAPWLQDVRDIQRASR